MEILLKILKEFLSNETIKSKIKELDKTDAALLHFGTGMYIRNKYLWLNEDNVMELSELMGVDHPDEISRKIVNILLYILRDDYTIS